MEQIYYGDWGADLSPEHESYWRDIDWLCDVISLQLGNFSTILVSQIKEKFGQIRCYCHFASHEMVQERYDAYSDEISRRNIEYLEWKGNPSLWDPEGMPWKVRLFEEEGEFPLPKESFEEFRQECYNRDARHYRKTYLELAKRFPQYRYVICGAADWHEYLFETEDELDTHFDDRAKYYTDTYDEDYTWSLQERLDDVEKGRTLAKKVSGWASKETEE